MPPPSPEQLALDAGTTDLRDRATALLRESLGRSDADFRDGQWEAIEALVTRNARLLVVQRTGWGKSSVYFLTTRLLRERGAGPSILVSPLLALMRDQVRAAERIGVRAATINSTNMEEWEDVTARVRAGDVDILLVSPERLASDSFCKRVLDPILADVGLFVVDEAHCISDWGHDFRPDYRRLRTLLPRLAPDVPVLATTATANDAVVADVVEQLGGKVDQLRGPLMRKSLHLQAIHLPSEHERMAWLAEQLPRIEGSGIVYVLTKPHARRVAGYLRANGVDAHPYTGGSVGGAAEERRKRELEQQLLRNEVKAVVATPALGMGFDKPDLAFVIHFQMPQSLIHYYQQVGRAGRAVDDAYGVLLYGDGDRRISEFFIAQAFPPAEVFASVLEALARSASGLSLAEVAKRSGVGRSLCDKVLKQLAVADDPPVRRAGARWVATGTSYEVDVAHREMLTRRREAELERMWRYAEGGRCLMAYMAAELDDPTVGECGRCSVCRGGPLLPESVSGSLRAAAETFSDDKPTAAGPKRGRKVRPRRSRASGDAKADGAPRAARSRRAPSAAKRTKRGASVRSVDRSTAIGYVDQALGLHRSAGAPPAVIESLGEYRSELERVETPRVDQRTVMSQIKRIVDA